MSTTNQITNATNYTAQEQAKQARITGSASAQLTSAEFLSLILKQLQFQDPMEPQGNTEFVSQQCQLSQLQETSKMSVNSASMQAASLVGENVTLINPKDKLKAPIIGTVTSANINGENSSLDINGKNYPLSWLKSVNSTVTATTQ